METRAPQGMIRPSQCAGCGSFIHDQYILRVSPDLEWHAACLRCAECRAPLDENCTCFVRNGKTYCKNDYSRLFGAKCDKCGDNFRKTDFVMRAKEKIYHMQCFRCVLCEKQLVTGDEFALTSEGVCCRDDHKPLESNNNISSKHSSLSSNTISAKKITDFDRKTDSPLKVSGILSPSGDSNESTATNGKRDRKSSDSKTTRVRTVLNEKQLHTLRTCYNANPRPDALMKEQLVEMTGLSPRVIRVWFQNKRCKDKKREIYLKQLQEQGKGGRFGGIGQVPAVPMVAGSPVRHGSPLPGQMVDVHAYQPPWKALTEFALQSDLEHMDPANSALQHLANQMHGYGLDTSAACSFPVETDLRYSTPDDMLADFPEHQSDISSHSD